MMRKRGVFSWDSIAANPWIPMGFCVSVCAPLNVCNCKYLSMFFFVLIRYAYVYSLCVCVFIEGSLYGMHLHKTCPYKIYYILYFFWLFELMQIFECVYRCVCVCLSVSLCVCFFVRFRQRRMSMLRREKKQRRGVSQRLQVNNLQ